jgi:hypothetical protein
MECMRKHAIDEDKYKQNGKMLSWRNFEFNFGRARFFVSPARLGETHDMSGNSKENINK